MGYKSVPNEMIELSKGPLDELDLMQEVALQGEGPLGRGDQG